MGGFKAQELLVQESVVHSRTPYCSTLHAGPPGSGDTGLVLFDLFPRLKSSGTQLAWGAKWGALPGLLAGSPSMALSWTHHASCSR